MCLEYYQVFSYFLAHFCVRPDKFRLSPSWIRPNCWFVYTTLSAMDSLILQNSTWLNLFVRWSIVFPILDIILPRMRMLLHRNRKWAFCDVFYWLFRYFDWILKFWTNWDYVFLVIDVICYKIFCISPNKRNFKILLLVPNASEIIKLFWRDFFKANCLLFV